MNEKIELKLLREFLKLVEQPEEARKRFFRYTKIAMLLSWLLIFYCLSDNIELAKQQYLFLVCAVVAGILLGISLWFLQAAGQAELVSRHLSMESMRKRIEELSQK